MESQKKYPLPYREKPTFFKLTLFYLSDVKKRRLCKISAAKVSKHYFHSFKIFYKINGIILFNYVSFILLSLLFVKKSSKNSH